MLLIISNVHTNDYNIALRNMKYVDFAYFLISAPLSNIYVFNQTIFVMIFLYYLNIVCNYFVQ